MEPHWRLPYASLGTLYRGRQRGLRALRKLEQQAKKARESRLPGDLEDLSRLAAAGLQSASAGLWDNPMFDFWLVLARLSRLAPETLAAATGFASLRARSGEGEAWAEPLTWKLSAGLPTDLIDRGIFGPVLA